MESDFSIRNEVDSIHPPGEDKFEHNTSSGKHDDLFKGLGSLPRNSQNPFLQGFHGFGQTPTPSIDNSQLYKMLEEQQSFNRYLMTKMTEQQAYWKWLFLGLLGVFAIYLLKEKTQQPIVITGK